MITRKFKGVCPVCQRELTLLTDQRVGRHGTKDPNDWPPKNCAGYGQLGRQVVAL